MARRPNEFYPTPSALTDYLVQYLRLRGRCVLEPCAGKGDISNILRKKAAYVMTNDIDVEMPAMYRIDFTKTQEVRRAFAGKGIDWVITNPPFTEGVPMLANAWDIATEGVAMLVRLSFLEGAHNTLKDKPIQAEIDAGICPSYNRGALLSKLALNLSHCIVFANPRPKFRLGEINPQTGKKYGTDSVTTCWLVWQKRSLAFTQLIVADDWTKFTKETPNG